MSAAREDDVGLARSLGRFFGHLLKSAKTDVRREDADGRETRVLRKDVEEEEVETSRGKVTVRRTVIEEIEAPRSERNES